MKLIDSVEKVNSYEPSISLPSPFRNEIPQQLKELNRWAVCEYFWNETLQEWEMVFLNPQKGVEADSDDLETLLCFNDALKLHNQWRFTGGDGCDGIGFLHLPEDDFQVFSFRILDNFRFAEELKFDDYLGSLQSYSEKFKDRINVFIKAAPIDYDYKNENFRVLPPGNFVPITGYRLSPENLQIEDQTAESLLTYNAIKAGDFTPETKCLHTDINYIEDEINFYRLLCQQDGQEWSINGLEYWETKLKKIKRLKPQDKKNRYYFEYLKGKKHFKHTDSGNGERFVAQHHEKVRYVHPWKQWLIWDGSRWKTDSAGEIKWLAKRTARSISLETSEDGSLQKALENWQKQSESEPRKKAMLESAQSEIGIAVDPEELDSDPWLLNLKNGIFYLKDSVLLSHDPDYLITKMTPVIYDPYATAPMWEKFLDTIFDRNNNLINFLKRAVGYSLTGDIDEQCLFFLYGSGANGKSTFLEVIRSMLGDYARQTDFSTFLSKKNDTIRNDLARLKGARFVSAVEADQGREFSETLIKQVTGSDHIMARFLYKEYFEFLPTFKIFLAANHKPEIHGTDDAIWRRIKLIPFNVTIPEDKRDRKMAEKLKSELPGIFNWALEGCQEWQDIGLSVPDEVKLVTVNYRTQMDSFKMFISNCCKLNPNAETPKAELFDFYVGHCRDVGFPAIGKIKFGERIKELGCREGKAKIDGKVIWVWVGIDLKTDTDEKN